MKNYKHYTVLKETLKIISEVEEYRADNYSPYKDYQSDEYDDNYIKLTNKLAKSYFFEYNQYYKTDYFLGCSFKAYEKTYNQRLEDYKIDFFDSDEISFIIEELDEGVYNYKFKELESEYFDNNILLRYEKLKKQIYYSLKKRFEYLCQRAKENGYDLVYNEFSPKEANYFLKHIKQPLETKNEEIKSISESPLLESNSTINEIKTPKDLDYFKIGALIAQGKLTTKKGGKFQYQGKNFNKQDITKQLESDLDIKSVRQYIEGTFGADTDSTLSKDLFRNETKIKKIVEYCRFNNIQITKEYQSLFDNLELLH